jgi:iron complex outermembrane receptor protein
MVKIFPFNTRSGHAALAIASLTASLAALPAQAEETKPQESGGDIVVTARLRAEDLQDVPAAISAFTADDLKKQSIQGLENLAAATPGLSFQSIGGTYQAPVIRGLAQVDQTGVIGNVGVFVDGIYLNNRSGLEFGFMDLARVEVVKGPQSALYGRNTFSGAINYVTPEPSTDAVGGTATGEVGDHGRRSIQGAINLPIAQGVALRAWGGIGKFDGTIYNKRDGKDIGGYSKRSNWGAALLVKPGDRMSIKLFFTRSDFDEDQAPYNFVDTSANNCGSQSVGPRGARYTLYCGKVPYSSSVDLNDTEATGLTGHQIITYAKANYDVDFAKLTGTIGYTRASFGQNNDGTGSATAISTPLSTGSIYSQQTFGQTVGNASDEWSYDLKLTSSPDHPLRWIAGVYHYDSSVSDGLLSYYTLLNQINTHVLGFARGGTTDIKGWAAYGMGEYDVTSALTVSVEGRYSWDRQHYQGLASVSSAQGDAKYNYFTPKGTVKYTFMPGTMAWVSAGKGYKIGGFNSNAAGLSQFSFGPETNWTYELGAKSALFDDKLVLAATLFYIDWSNIQVQGAIPSSTLAVVQNSKGATSKGIEWESTYNFTRNLWLRGSVALMDPKYKNGTSDAEVAAACGEIPGSTVLVSGCSSDVGGNQLARTTKQQFNVSGNWTLPDAIGDFDFYVRADYSFQKSKHSTSLNQDEQGNIELVNAQIGLQSEHLTISAWVKNLFDAKYLARVTTVPSTSDGAPLTGVTQSRSYPGERRTIGLRATYSF